MNKYEIMDMIDEGAYGIVWKAANKDTGMLGNFLLKKLQLKNLKKVIKTRFREKVSNEKFEC